MKRNFKPMIDRWDIYNNLPPGGQAELSRELKCSQSHVYNVLHGYRKDNKEIIKSAELMAAIYLWKSRFCKISESQL